MPSPNLTAPLTTLAQALHTGALTAHELTEATLQQIQATQPYEAYLYVNRAPALAWAQQCDATRARGAMTGCLAGLPIALKDNLVTQEMPTTCGSRLLAGYQAPYDATVVTRLRDAGAVLVGKTALDEFAMGSTSQSCATSAPKNPWDAARVPGGSSGGSAIAVATGAAAAALGSDTGGSVRQPAAFCGVVGLKPTYGRLSRFGLVAFASSFDQVGILSRYVADVEPVLLALAGPDPCDTTTHAAPVFSPSPSFPLHLADCRIGVLPEAWLQGVEPELQQTLERTREELAAHGATCVPVTLPPPREALTAYQALSAVEAMSNLARYDGLRYGCAKALTQPFDARVSQTRAEFGNEAKCRLLWGSFLLTDPAGHELLCRARAVWRQVHDAYRTLLAEVTLVLLPVTPSVAFPRLDTPPDTLANADLFTVGASLAGLPAISVPRGLNAQGLPLAVQLVGRTFDEATLLRVAQHVEQPCHWSERSAAELL